eukprot:TRINITY_DN2101_c0_g1_i2.p1 TRINITY_DN2101_c0_g1~~TRINITY_DN2101_c0_g1_i2.p1  ORF type:complete len:412 (-),score=67.12 TRINITY_DN2101_c0_g1_i2:112-1266(-)
MQVCFNRGCVRQRALTQCKIKRNQFRCLAYDAPSMAPAKSELESLRRWSVVVPDTIEEHEQGCPTAATVSALVLEGIMKNPAGDRQYENAIENARTYEKCSGLETQKQLECQYAKALANVGALFAEQVSGRVSVEVNPSSSTTEEMVSEAGILLPLFEDLGVEKDRVLMRLPGTWEGIQAAKQLEARGINTHIALVYSLIQAVVAAQSGVSLIQINVGRLQDWYQKYPGIIKNPKGPREDSGGSSSLDPALFLLQQIFYYLRKFYPDTKVMVSGLRSKTDVLSLAGCDFIVVSTKILKQLSSSATSEGYNDGLHAEVQEGVECALSLQKLSSIDIPEIGEIDKAIFTEQLGLVGQDMLQQGLESLRSDFNRIMPFFSQLAIGTE